MELTQLGRVIFAFLFVMALMYGVAWLARRFKLDEKMQLMGTKRAKGNFSLEESFWLDAKRRLVVVAHHKARYLLLLGPNGDTLLSAHDASSVEEPGAID